LVHRPFDPVVAGDHNCSFGLTGQNIQVRLISFQRSQQVTVAFSCVNRKAAGYVDEIIGYSMNVPRSRHNANDPARRPGPVPTLTPCCSQSTIFSKARKRNRTQSTPSRGRRTSALVPPSAHPSIVCTVIHYSPK
jgi:hypothetical protein